MIIGLSGLKGSGKDTAGQYLVERYGFERLSFAEPLKVSAAAVFGLTLEDMERTKNDDDAVILLDIPLTDDPADERRHLVTMTIRQYLQRYGTEAHRDVFGKNFWTDQLFGGLDVTGNYVITDARFENEIGVTREKGGIIVSIERPGIADGDTHASEDQFPELTDYTVVNDGSIQDLYREIDALMIDQLGLVPGAAVAAF